MAAVCSLLCQHAILSALAKNGSDTLNPRIIAALYKCQTKPRRSQLKTHLKVHVPTLNASNFGARSLDIFHFHKSDNKLDLTILWLRTNLHNDFYQTSQPLQNTHKAMYTEKHMYQLYSSCKITTVSSFRCNIARHILY